MNDDYLKKVLESAMNGFNIFFAAFGAVLGVLLYRVRQRAAKEESKKQAHEDRSEMFSDNKSKDRKQSDAVSSLDKFRERMRRDGRSTTEGD